VSGFHRFAPALSGLLLAVPAPPAVASTPEFNEILHLQDGRYSNAARVAYEPWTGALRLAWKAQLGTDSSTRQIAVGARTWDTQPPGWALQDLTTHPSSKEYPDIAVTSDSVSHIVWREAVGTVRALDSGAGAGRRPLAARGYRRGLGIRGGSSPPLTGRTAEEHRLDRPLRRVGH